MNLESSLYFAQIGEHGPIKIGVTSDKPLDRIACLQCGCPWPIRLIGSVGGERDQEVILHERLSQYRMLGEWFEPHMDVLVTVQTVLIGSFVWPASIPPSALLTVLSRLRRDVGGHAAFAKLVQLPQNSLRKWFDRGRIPARYWSTILHEAGHLGLDYVTPELLVHLHARQPHVGGAKATNSNGASI